MTTERYNLGSVAEEEKEFFNKLSKEWWDKDFGPMKGLHTLNKLRVPYIVDCLKKGGQLDDCYVYSKKPLTGLNILDVGCGGGILSESLARLGGVVTGVDPGADLIKVAKKHAELSEIFKIQYINTTIEEFCLKNEGKFDVVIVAEVLEHVINKEIFVKSCCKCIKPGGSIFVSGVNKTFYSWFVTIVLWERVFRVVPIGTHDWDKYITPEDAIQILEDNNCKLKHSTGVDFNLLSFYWYKTTSLSIMYVFNAVKAK